MSRYRGAGREAREEESTMHGLIKELLKVWSTKAVQDRYQNYFLVYLDALPEKDAELAIAKEIRLTLENRSHYFCIKRALAVHKGILGRLQRSLDEIRGAKDSAMVDMGLFGSLLEQLRSSNLEVAESVLQFNYECLGNGKHSLELITGNNYLLEEINSDNQLLKNSFLEDYIAFSDSYDPFLLFHYEHSKKTLSPKAQNFELQQIFNLSVSQAYKFMKAQQEILEFLSGKLPSKLIYGKIKRINYQFIDKKTSQEATPDSKSYIFKLENDAYIKKSIDEGGSTEGELFLRAKTEQSPLKGIIFNTKHPKKTSTYFQYRHQLPRIENMRRTEANPVESPPLFNYRQPNVRKFSEQGSTSKYTFKIRRRMSIRTNNNDSPSSLGEWPRGYIQSINRIMRREEEFLKHSDHRRRVSVDKREQSQNASSPREDIMEDNQDEEREAPLANKFTQELRTLKVQPILMERQAPVPSGSPKTYKNFKLKAGNLKVNNVFVFLQELSIQPYYRSMFQVQNWEHLLRNNQYYLHKFYIDEVLQAISLCCGLPDGNILIKYWAPLETCDREMSNFLFKKYLEHVERNSTCSVIYYSLSEIPELGNNGFVKYNQKILAKYRTIPQEIDSFSYFPFLSVNFSIIAVPKSIAKQEMDSITVKSNKVVPFNEKEFTCFNYLLITNKIINLASGFSAFGTYTPNIKNFREVGTKLIKEELFETAYNTELKIGSTNLMTLRLRHPVHSPFFVAAHPLIKFIGEEVYCDSESLVASLQLVKSTKMYFGKGFTSINSLMTVIKNRPASKKKIEYCVRMFAKRMRGRLLSINLRDEYCFGDFEVLFEWVDFLKGKIDQDLKGYQTFGGEGFYCIIQIQNQYILGFEIKPDNLL